MTSKMDSLEAPASARSRVLRGATEAMCAPSSARPKAAAAPKKALQSSAPLEAEALGERKNAKKKKKEKSAVGPMSALLGGLFGSQARSSAEKPQAAANAPVFNAMKQATMAIEKQ